MENTTQDVSRTAGRTGQAGPNLLNEMAKMPGSTTGVDQAPTLAGRSTATRVNDRRVVGFDAAVAGSGERAGKVALRSGQVGAPDAAPTVARRFRRCDGEATR